jgi:predicted Zn-dependent protease
MNNNLSSDNILSYTFNIWIYIRNSFTPIIIGSIIYLTYNKHSWFKIIDILILIYFIKFSLSYYFDNIVISHTYNLLNEIDGNSKNCIVRLYYGQFNAFAAYGNQIFIGSELVRYCSVNELNFVIAHEYAHHVKNHNVIRYYTQYASQSISSIAHYFTDKKSDFWQLITIFTDWALWLANMKLSRNEEFEADQIAFNYLFEKNISINGSYDFFNKLIKMHNIEVNIVSKTINIIDTHPLPQERIEALKIIEKKLRNNSKVSFEKSISNKSINFDEEKIINQNTNQYSFVFKVTFVFILLFLIIFFMIYFNLNEEIKISASNFKEAKVHYNAKNYSKSIECLLNAIKFKNNIPPYIIFFKNEYLKYKNITEISSYYEFLGNSYYFTNDNDNAINAYLEAIKFAPNKDIFFNLGVIYLNKKERKEANTMFKNVYELDYNDTEAIKLYNETL